MNCSDFAEWIAQKLDGRLPDNRLGEFENHLARCNRCRAELALQRKIQEALSEQLDSGLSIDFTRRVCEKAVRAARQEKRPLLWPRLVPAFASVGAAVVMLLVWPDFFRVSPPQTGDLIGMLLRPLVWAADGAMGLFSRLAASFGSAPLGSVSLPAWFSQPLARTLMASALSCIPAVWALRRALVFIRR